MNEADRQLLVWAAFAAGYDYLSDDGCISCDPPHEHVLRQWNPLTDDGDALRLMVKLNISVETDAHIQVAVYEYQGRHEGEYEIGVESWHVSRGGKTVNVQEVYGSDPSAACRRAIVRVAAEIGKGLI